MKLSLLAALLVLIGGSAAFGAPGLTLDPVEILPGFADDPAGISGPPPSRARSFFDSIDWSAGGFLGIYIPTSSTAKTSVGVEFAGQGIARFELMKGEQFPFAVVLPFRLELKYVGGTSRYFSVPTGWQNTSVASILFLFKVDFGVDLLWKMEKMLLFPFGGIGMGMENTSGSNITYNGTRFVFSFQLGAGYAYFLTEKIYALGRIEWGINAGANNIRHGLSFCAGGGIAFG